MNLLIRLLGHKERSFGDYIADEVSPPLLLRAERHAKENALNNENAIAALNRLRCVIKKHHAERSEIEIGSPKQERVGSQVGSEVSGIHFSSICHIAILVLAIILSWFLGNDR